MNDFPARLTQALTLLVEQAPRPLQANLRNLLLGKDLGSMWSNLIVHTATVWEAPVEAVVRVGAALRCFYTAANWLDDVIDGEAPAVEVPAIVNGSAALLALGQSAIFALKEPLPVIQLLNQTWLAAASGEQLDLEVAPLEIETVGKGQTEEDYLEQARLKTGFPLAATCIAVASQAEEDPLNKAETAALHDFGANFGIVLQIENDLNALSPEALGKTDLASLKTMLPLIFLRDKVSPASYAGLLAKVRENEPEARRELFGLLADTGALQYGHLLGHLHMQEAVSALVSVPRGLSLARLLGLVEPG